MIAPGKVSVTKSVKTEYMGIELPDNYDDMWGIVVHVGYPEKMYYWYQILWYVLTGRHPFPFKKGTKVLIPRGGTVMTIEGEPLCIFNQSQILSDDKL